MKVGRQRYTRVYFLVLIIVSVAEGLSMINCCLRLP